LYSALKVQGRKAFLCTLIRHLDLPNLYIPIRSQVSHTNFRCCSFSWCYEPHCCWYPAYEENYFASIAMKPMSTVWVCRLYINSETTGIIY